VLIGTDFRRVIRAARSPVDDRDHISIGLRRVDIKRKYPAQNIGFSDDPNAAYIAKSEPEAQKHLLDRSTAAHGGFEASTKASQ
jgi:hypothetical protein